MINKNNYPKIRFLRDSLLINEDILVFGDLHIGYEKNLENMGIIPRVQIGEIIKKLDSIFSLLNNEKIIIKKIIILGDLKHCFGSILDLEWEDTLKLFDYLESKINSKGKKDNIILIRGNHDTILKPIAKKRNLKVRDYYLSDNICYLHGDKNYKECLNAKIIIIGHLHPAITISDKYKSEKYKCFLKGKSNGKIVYVLPNFCPISYGYDLRGLFEFKRDFSIIKNRLLKNFDVIIYNERENEAYNFGKLKKLI